MKCLLLFAFFILGFVPAIPQAVSGALQMTQVKTAVQQILSSAKPRVKITLRNLMKLEGTISRSNDESFSLKNKKGGNRLYYVPYREVLVLEGKDIFLSFFPDPEQTSFGEWERVRRLKHGEIIDSENIQDTNV